MPQNELQNLLAELKNLNYVVQRNFENLPDSYIVGEHGDLDLFSTDTDKPKIEEIVRKYNIPCDVRSAEDLYYPEEIGQRLLTSRKLVHNFWVPSTYAHFLSLFYHNAVHKQGNPYGEKLKELFLELYPPVKCTDNGVGWYL